MDDLPELPPAPPGRFEAKLAAVDRAARLFREQPSFARIRIRLAGRIEQLSETKSLVGSEARAKLVLKWFDSHARALLPLVKSGELLKGYEDILAHLRDLAWEGFTGYPPDIFWAVGKFFVEIEEDLNKRERKWVSKARERIAPETRQPADSKAKGERSCDGSASVDDFLEKCTQVSGGIKIIRKHIWKAAKHKTPRQFEHWQRCDAKATAQDNVNFGRILSMDPADFISELKKKGII